MSTLSGSWCAESTKQDFDVIRTGTMENKTGNVSEYEAVGTLTFRHASGDNGVTDDVHRDRVVAGMVNL